ncbi:hypothetical protein BX666DRAFT_2124763 [Dichotomocladium elegans]|nr:hypothetical protein BX666DRAFT_2124763 [Dichotomocladium elegans]
MLEHPQNSLASRFGVDILSLILSYLDPYTIASFSETCRFFRDMVRRELSFESAVWYHHRHSSHTRDALERNTADRALPLSWHGLPQFSIKPPQRHFPPPPVFHPRCLVKIGRQLYMPFMATKPGCYVYEIDDNVWMYYPLLHTCAEYSPFVAPVVAVGNRLFMVGGRKIVSGLPSNEVHVINIETWSLERLQLMQGPLPVPRCDHTVDVLENRYLLIFGGICGNSLGENDLDVFDTMTNTWTEPRMTGQIPSVRYGHASAMSGHNLYIFGGCETRAEGLLVHDDLYRLDCISWTWYKYDYPEAYPYRRTTHDAPRTDVLRRNLIMETTGQPPRDRFHCVLQPAGQHKLLIFGGHTVRQDSEDHNVLHAHSLESIDVFDVRRNHWSSVATSPAFDEGENNIYPQDISVFPIHSNHFLVVGQQKIFLTQTESSSEHSDSLSSPSYTSHRTPPPSVESLLPLPPPQQQQQHSFARNELVVRAHHPSRSMADYEGFLDSILHNEDDEDEDESHHGSPPVDGALRSMPIVKNNRFSGILPDEKQHHVDRHYTLEPLCIVLALNQA